MLVPSSGRSHGLTSKQPILTLFCETLGYRLPEDLSSLAQLLELRFMNGDETFCGACFFAHGAFAV